VPLQQSKKHSGTVDAKKQRIKRYPMTASLKRWNFNANASVTTGNNASALLQLSMVSLHSDFFFTFAALKSYMPDDYI
jgi:hypothetical protein